MSLCVAGDYFCAQKVRCECYLFDILLMEILSIIYRDQRKNSKKKCLETNAKYSRGWR